MILNPVTTEKGLMRIIQKRRKEIGITQVDVAEALEYDPGTICHYESCKRHISVDTLFRYLDLLGLEMHIITKAH